MRYAPGAQRSPRARAHKKPAEPGRALDKVAQRAKISKLSIYRHFENKEALFSAPIAARCHQFAPQALFEGVDGSAEDQLMAEPATPVPPHFRPEGSRRQPLAPCGETGPKSFRARPSAAGPPARSAPNASPLPPM